MGAFFFFAGGEWRGQGGHVLGSPRSPPLPSSSAVLTVLVAARATFLVRRVQGEEREEGVGVVGVVDYAATPKTLTSFSSSPPARLANLTRNGTSRTTILYQNKVPSPPRPPLPPPQPPKNLTASLAALQSGLNATKTALTTEVALKTGAAGAVVDGTLPRFAGASVTCYVDPATGDVVGLALGSSPPLCSTAGTPRSFAVPADGYISAVKVTVDKATGLVGEMAFVVKSNSSLIPTNVVTCGAHGGVGVNVMPKAAALASVAATCKPAQTGRRRLHQAAPGLAIDPASLTVAATTVNAPGTTAPMPAPAPSGPFSFVSDYNAGTVYACTGSATLACRVAATGVNTPFGMALSGSLLYVTDYAGGVVNACMGANSAALSCAPAVSGLTYPAGVAISGSYAYLADGNSGGGVSACTGVGSGTLTCSSAAGGLGIPAGIAVSGSYAYVTDRSGSGNVYACSGVGSGTLTCGVAVNTGGEPRGIAISGSYAYIADWTAGAVSACTGVGTGTLTCSSLAVTSLGNIAGIAISGSYAYITSYSRNIVYSCTGVGTATLTCSTATGLSGAWAVTA